MVYTIASEITFHFYMNTTKKVYLASDEAKKTYAAYNTVTRIIGYGWGNGSGPFATDERFIGLPREQQVLKLLDTPEMMTEFENSSLDYSVANASALTLFNLYKKGTHVDASKYGPDIERIFNAKVAAYKQKVTA